MFRNYLKTAWRNMLRNRLNSIINIGGLTTGIACVILIVLYVHDELSYDKFFKNADRIFQVNLEGNFGGQQFYAAASPPPVGISMKNEFPEVETYTRTFRLSNQIVRNGTGTAANTFTERNILGVDSNFLQVFSYAFKDGSAASCLKKTRSVVLTESSARKYFGNGSAIGKTIVFDEYKQPFIVTGVLRDVPSNSTLQFDMLIPIEDCPAVKYFSWSWVWSQVMTYVVLNDNIAHDKAAVQRLEAKFPSMVKRDAVNAFKRIGQPLDEFFKKGGKWDFHLQSLKDVHLYSADILTPFTTLGDIKYVYIFSAIALFIIILACVNFMNLSTAQAARRSKEVGVRKVLGSLKSQLIKQFFTEAFLYSVVATILAIFLAGLLMQPFNFISGKTLHFINIFQNGNWIFIVLLCIVSGLLAGSYPAFYLTSFSPVAVLKGSGLFSKSLGNLFIRNGLVVFQFTVSIALIICTIVVFKQLQYAQTKDLGLNKENVIIIPNVTKLQNNKEAFKQELKQIPGVTNVTISTDVPGQSYNGFTDFYVPDANNVKEPLSKDATLSSFIVDEEFIPTLQIKLLEGRNFSKEYNDSLSVIVNETTVKQIGWKEPLGKYITYPGGNNQHYKVIGVVKDFNIQSLKTAVTSFALFHVSSKSYDIGTAYVLASVQSAQMQKTLRDIETKWKQSANRTPFAYSFLDQDYDAMYRSEKRMGTVFGIFTALSIIVACLGLFGLSVYTAERRTKEIGIRKVLGASVQSVVTLLSKEFLQLVLVATIVAFPVAWWAMSNWLQSFAYRITLGWWIFIAAGFLAFIIALATISFQSIKAAVANPVKSLRTE